jgi:ribose 5-phosphate isomerase A
LLREKIVATASERLIIVADARKLTDRLGGTAPVPIEVVPFGWETTAERLGGLGTEPALRRSADGQVFRTDGGNLILDCRFGALSDPAGLDQALSRVVGVVETGLFIGMAKLALVAGEQGVQRVTCAD